MQKRWIGRWLIVVSIIHTIFALIVFGTVLADIVAGGFVNSIGEDPMRAAVAWFILAGGFMFLAGLAIDALEAVGAVDSFRLIGVGMALVTLLGLIWMPVSGFWMIIPLIIGLFMKKVSD